MSYKLITGVCSKLPGDLKIHGDDEPQNYARKLGYGLLKIVIHGTPLGKPRQTQRDKWAKRPCVMRYRGWADRARAAAGLMLPPADSVTSLDWTAFFEPPKSWSKKKRCAAIGELHRVPFDLDNLAKSLCDALWPNGDSAIAAMQCEKRWGWKPRIEITIRYVE